MRCRLWVVHFCISSLSRETLTRILVLHRYDKIQAMTDMKKLARLEAYMRREEFCSTAEVARRRLQSLESSAAKQEAPVLPARLVGTCLSCPAQLSSEP
jgi:hypothetical protein